MGFFVFLMFLLPIAGAFISFYAGKKSYKLMCDISIAAAALTFISAFIVFIASISTKAVCINLKDLYIEGITLKADGFRALYCVIFAFMWLTEINYSKEYMEHHKNRERYYLFMLITLSAVFGVFLSQDFLTTFLFFEIMSLTSYVWVAQEENEEALYASSTYLYVSLVCGLVMLMGLFLVRHTAGTLEFDGIYEYIKANGINGRIWGGAVCMLIGFGAKAGMYPVHVWLPKAHPAAPAPASALLSGALTKCGVYGVLIITAYIFNGNKVWGTILLAIGTITMLAGAVMAVFSLNIKRTLACSSMSQIGFITVGMAAMAYLGEDNSLAVNGTIFHMINHSIIKLILFTCAGVIYTKKHTLLLNEIKGVLIDDKILKYCFLAGALAIAGIPLFSGYISKTIIHEGLVESYNLFKVLKLTDEMSLLKLAEYLFLAAGGLTAAYMAKLYITVFTDKFLTKASKNVKNKRNAIEKKNIIKKNDIEKLDVNKITTRVLLCCAAAMLFLCGIMPNIIFGGISRISTGFLKAVRLYGINFFSIENLKGAMISITIGAFVYFIIIRKLLMDKNGNHLTKTSYIDIEKNIYRPVFGSFLPFVGAVFARTADVLVDTIVKVLGKTIYKPAAKKKDRVGTAESYFAGTILDGIVKFINMTIRRKKPLKISFVELMAVGERTALNTTRIIVKTVSFGLLMFSIGLLITMFYLLFGI